MRLAAAVLALGVLAGCANSGTGVVPVRLLRNLPRMFCLALISGLPVWPDARGPCRAVSGRRA